MKGINTWAVPLVRYSGPFVKWTEEELRQMDQRTRKLMMMHKALHAGDDINRFSETKKKKKKKKRGEDLKALRTAWMEQCKES